MGRGAHQTKRKTNGIIGGVILRYQVHITLNTAARDTITREALVREEKRDMTDKVQTIAHRATRQ